MKLIRRKDLSELTGISRAHLYLLIGEGRFPRQIHIGKRASAWIQEEVQAWVDGAWYEGMTTSPTLESPLKLVDRKTLLGMIGFNKDTLYRMIKTGDFPPCISKDIPRWKYNDIVSWVAKKITIRDTSSF
ncbi:AlpA family phage regulatory protein [Vibrio cholerae]|uniref:helix-turn-helix transcriptional regulator n=1 Tax=Vibrio TaxID=662 RepID=UPI000C17061A|nr:MULTISPECIES: AlpA family phage regulatory protein [Vibrio]